MKTQERHTFPRGWWRGSVLLFCLTCIPLGCGGDNSGPVTVDSVDLGLSGMVLSVGESFQLIAMTRDAAGNLLAGRALAWSTSNEAVASVSSSGLVTGVSGGTAAISATSDGKTGTASVTISDLGIGFGPEQFAVVTAGIFQMGDITGDGGASARPAHTVRISEPFSIQRTEVTQGQWETVMGATPSYYKTCGNACPVDQVSWLDIQEFLSALDTIDPGRNYRLPTEAEWEYACRAGTTGNWAGTGVRDEMGWYPDNSAGQTSRVARKLPNAWGLYDMHGNVSEWVQDWYSDLYYQESPEDDPPGPASGEERVFRGGSMNPVLAGSPGTGSTSSSRGKTNPSNLAPYLGFRVVRDQ